MSQITATGRWMAMAMNMRRKSHARLACVWRSGGGKKGKEHYYELSGAEEWHRAVIFDADGAYRGLLVNIVDIIVTYNFPGDEPVVRTVVTFCDGRTFVVNEDVCIGDRPEYAGRRWTIEEAHTFMQLYPQGLDFFREDAIAYWCDIELAGEPLFDVGIVYMPS